MMLIDLTRGDESWAQFYIDVQECFNRPTFISWDDVSDFLRWKYNASHIRHDNDYRIRIMFNTEEGKTEFILRYL